MLNRRTNILLDKERYDLVVSAARRAKVSIGELIRQAIDEKLKNKDDEIIRQRTKAVNEIYRLQKKMKPLPTGFDYKSLINWGRRF